MQLVWLEKFDKNQLVEIYELYKEQWWTQDRSFNEFKQMQANTDLFFACYTDHKLIGFARVLTDTIFKAIIFDLIVKSEYQSQGLGRIILNYILNHQKLEKVKSFELYCPEHIASFYEKSGFKRSDSIILQKK